MSKKIMNKPSFLVVGRAGLDLYAQQTNTDLTKVTSFERHVGGSAANISVALSRQQATVKLATNLADDEWGVFIKNYLIKNKVAISGKMVKTPTRNSLAITEIKPESKVLFYRHDPSDMTLSPEQVSEKEVEKVDALILTGTSFSECPSREAVFIYLYYAEKLNKTVFLDLDHRPSGWKNQYEVFVYYSLVMERCDVLIGTLDEFHEVMKFLQPNKKKFSDRQIASFFLAKGKGRTKLVVIKKGSKGSVVFQTESQNKLEVSSGGVFKVKVKKNFGAGDAFAGFFCYHWMKTGSLSEAVKRGSAAAAIVVSKGTCTDAMPTERALAIFMKNHKYSQ